MTDPRDAFRRRLLHDEEAQDRLDRTVDPDVFAADAVAQARDWGIALSRAALSATPPPLRCAMQPGPHWHPARVTGAGEDAEIAWARFGADGLRHSFFADSAAAARARPLNRLLRPVTRLADLPPPDGAADPAGFVFHMSRCGSTLIAQMLGAVPGVAVLSEPDPFDAALRLVLAAPDRAEHARIATLRTMLALLSPPGRRIVVKLDSWHILAFPLLRAAFPDVPWVYLFRDPADVIVSHRRRPGMQTVPDLMPPALRPAEPIPIAIEARAAAVLAAFHDAAVAALAEGRGLAIAYTALPDAVAARIAPHFGLALNDGDRAALAATARRDAKYPDRVFLDDSGGKCAESDAEVRAAAERLAGQHARLLATAAPARG